MVPRKMRQNVLGANETLGLDISRLLPPVGHFHSPEHPAKAPARFGISPLKPVGLCQFGTRDPASCGRVKAARRRQILASTEFFLFLSTRRFVLMGSRSTEAADFPLLQV